LPGLLLPSGLGTDGRLLLGIAPRGLQALRLLPLRLLPQCFLTLDFLTLDFLPMCLLSLCRLLLGLTALGFQARGLLPCGRCSLSFALLGHLAQGGGTRGSFGRSRLAFGCFSRHLFPDGQLPG
jgi:hypothetical protein